MALFQRLDSLQNGKAELLANEGNNAASAFVAVQRKPECGGPDIGFTIRPTVLAMFMVFGYYIAKPIMLFFFGFFALR